MHVVCSRLNFRRATADDLNVVHAIYADPRIAPGLGREPMSCEDFQPLFADLCARPALLLWQWNGVVIGFHHQSCLSGTQGSSAFLGSIALASDMQGRGLARRAMVLIIQSLQEQGMQRIELIVESTNARALSLYQGLGFHIDRTLERCSLRAGQVLKLRDHYMSL